MTDVPPNGNGIWKFSTSFLSGIVLTGIIWYLTQLKEIATRADVNQAVTYLSGRVDGQVQEISSLKATVSEMKGELHAYQEMGTKAQQNK